MTDRNHRGARGNARVRSLIAREAARLMYREGVSQYIDAKRVAARRICGREARGMQFRPRDLPSNGEIRAALLELVSLAEGRHREGRLFAMRIEALQILEALAAFHPRLIGSVWSGHARRGSDIDVHVFAEAVEDIEDALALRGWPFEREQVLIRSGNDFVTYDHLHLEDRPFPVELSVYPIADRRKTTRSSVDGKPIQRIAAGELSERIELDHPALWATWRRDGQAALARILADIDDDPDPGEFDGLLRELGGLFLPAEPAGQGRRPRHPHKQRCLTPTGSDPLTYGDCPDDS